MNPIYDEYDYELGIEPEIIDYVKESHVIESRISSTPCYLVFHRATGSAIGSSSSPLAMPSFYETFPFNKSIIWNGGVNYPDILDYLSTLTVIKDSTTIMTKVVEVEDIVVATEYSVIQRKDLIPPRVELAFHPTVTSSSLSYYFETLEIGTSAERFKRGATAAQSLHGWTQYLSPYSDSMIGYNQILIRMPLTTRDLIINEEGRVMMEENQSWMIWEPYVADGDMIIVPSGSTASGREERYEIINKQDSLMQGQLVSQRFKLEFLEFSDVRYNIAISTVYP